MPMSKTDRMRLAVAVQSNIQIHGLEVTQAKGAKYLLDALLNPTRQEETIKKCPPHMREEIEHRFNVIYENQEEALDLIQYILDPKWKTTKQ